MYRIPIGSLWDVYRMSMEESKESRGVLEVGYVDARTAENEKRFLYAQLIETDWSH